MLDGKLGFPGGSVVKNLPTNAGDPGDASLIYGSGRSPGGGIGNPLQYSHLENPMDMGAWQARVLGPASQSGTTEHARTQTMKLSSFGALTRWKGRTTKKDGADPGRQGKG